MSLVDRFFANLPTPLPSEVREYLRAALDDDGIDLQDLRSLVEPFLLDAGLDDTRLDSFFADLRLDCSELKKLQSSQSLLPEKKLPSPRPSEAGNCSLPAVLNPAGSTDGGARERSVPVVDKSANSTYGASGLSLPVVAKPADSTTCGASHRTAAVEVRALQSSDESTPRQSTSGSLNEQEEVEEPVVVAVSQVSRFHVDTIDTLATDVDLKGVLLSVNDHDLLVDANLRLFAGTAYGLVGRNGVGKSTLLKSIGHGLLIGFPKNIRVLYVEQLETADLSASVLSVVMSANAKTVAMRNAAGVLQSALDTGDVKRIALAVREIQMEKLIEAKEDALQIATKRSSTRGKIARTALLEAESAVEEARKKQQGFAESELKDAISTCTTMLEDLYAQLELVDDSGAEAKARKILVGLKFSTKWQDGPISLLSGGWRLRVALAQALFEEPDVLLLDEPTNHLDLPAILWLQSYLQSLTSTLVVVSHDRSFLNAVAQEIIVFRKQKLEYYHGNYDEYETNTENARNHLLKLKESEERKREHIEKSIQDGIRKAKKSGDDKKLGMVASRQKKLDRLGIEKDEKGHRYKVSNRPGWHEHSRVQIVIEKREATPLWSLPEPAPLRHAGSLIELDQVSFAYPGNSRIILDNITLNIEAGSRVGLVGANGQGKSTLFSLLVGDLEALRGTIKRHPQCRIGYFGQHNVGELYALPGKISALRYFMDQFEGAKEQDLRSHLGSFGIQGGLAVQPLKTLSGGQIVRVAVAKMVYRSPQLLVLDEPTNHLDMETIAAMIASLNTFTGSIVFASHDQYFVKTVAKVVYCLEDGAIKLLEGGVAEYAKRLLSRQKI